MNRKIECEYCHGKFHKKGIRNHSVKCAKRNIPAQTPTTGLFAGAYGEYERGREAGRKECFAQQGERLGQLIESVARLNNALATVIGEYR